MEPVKDAPGPLGFLMGFNLRNELSDFLPDVAMVQATDTE